MEKEIDENLASEPMGEVKSFFEKLRKPDFQAFGYAQKMPKGLADSFRSFIKTPTRLNYELLESDIAHYSSKNSEFERFLSCGEGDKFFDSLALMKNLYQKQP